MAPMQGKICVADDDPVLLQGLDRALRRRGYVVRTAGSGTELLSLVDADRPDLVIVDVGMPGMGGLEVLREVHTPERWPGLPVMLITALGGELATEPEETGRAAAVLYKPFHLEELFGRVERCLSEADQEPSRRNRSSHS